MKCEKIWKMWKKRRLNCEMIWKTWKKGKSNSDTIWTIWKKGKLKCEKDMENVEEKKVEL